MNLKIQEILLGASVLNLLHPFLNTLDTIRNDPIQKLKVPLNQSRILTGTRLVKVPPVLEVLAIRHKQPTIFLDRLEANFGI